MSHEQGSRNRAASPRPRPRPMRAALRVSARKLNLVAQSIRGKPASAR